MDVQRHGGDGSGEVPVEAEREPTVEGRLGTVGTAEEKVMYPFSSNSSMTMRFLNLPTTPVAIALVSVGLPSIPSTFSPTYRLSIRLSVCPKHKDVPRRTLDCPV